MQRPGKNRPAVVLALLGLALATALATSTSILRRPAAPPRPPAPASDVLASLPVSFEPTGDGGFVSRGPGYSLALHGSDAVLGVRGGTFRLRPAGADANRAASLVGARPLGGTVTRLVGDDPGRWAPAQPTYARVEARQAWPGVDIVWHGDQRRLEHDLVVAPGADPTAAVFDVDGATSLALDGGDLVVGLGEGTARLARPVAYQEVAGARRPVDAEFLVSGPARIGFRVGEYDRSLPLVVDPTLVTSTFLGGAGGDSGYAVALDGQGSIYVTGSTESTDFPTNAPISGTLSNRSGGPTSDVFVSKLSPDGSRLIWSTYLGGAGRDTGYALAVGGDGSVYVAGVTESTDFPRARAAQETYGAGASDAFVAKIAASGTSLDWSTYIGGSGGDRARGVAVDGAGNAYVTGSSNSPDFPAVNAYQPGPYRAEDLDVFVVKVPPAGAPLAYSTRLGGSNDDHGLAVAADAQGNAYLTGDTLSPGFPTVRPIQAGSGGSSGGVAGSFADAFVAKLNPNGSALVYSTFLGGADFDQGTAIAVDPQGAAYVAGNTNSSNFPIQGPLQGTKGNDADAFVSKIDPAGGALSYSTFVGGGGADGANAVAVDAPGNVYVTGTTGSTNWPTTKPTQAARGGGDDAFVLKLDAAGRGPLFSTYLGGRDADSGTGVAVDSKGVVHVLGLTGSTDFPSVKPVQGARPPAGGDAFVATIDPADAAATATTAGAPAPPAATTSTSSSAHDRRVRIFAGLTFALLAAAILQTIILRRRPVAVARPTTPLPKPPPPANLKVARPATGAAKKATAAKAPAGSKSNRTPKARGGPKGGGPQQAGGAQKATNRKTPARPKGGAAAAGAGAAVDREVVDDGGPATVATPVPEPPKPRIRPQEPGIAKLLEEDLWAPEPGDELATAYETPAGPPEPGPEGAPERPTADEPAPATAQWAPPAAPEEPEEPAPPPQQPIPPVPAAELSFWDLFPEDLPPARQPVMPVEDLLSDLLPLPDGPESAVGRLMHTPPPEPRNEPRNDPRSEPEPQPGFEPPGVPPEPPRPAAPPEAEIVIAELLDGPVPTGLRPPADSPWAAPAGQREDFVISELLAKGAEAQPPGPAVDGDDDGDDPEDDGTPAGRARTPEEQARIAADRARRRRARRSGRRRPGSG